MPTGYTAYIEDGKITNGNDFLMLCARAFEAYIDMRETPLDAPAPLEIKPSTYHLEQIVASKRSLEQYETMPRSVAEAIINAEFDKSVKFFQEGLARSKEKLHNYKAVLAGVEAWEPPTENHAKVKQFAIEQIQESMEHLSIDFYKNSLKHRKPDVDTWIATNLEYYQEQIDRHTEEWEAEQERAKQRTEWIKALFDSLGSGGTAHEGD